MATMQPPKPGVRGSRSTPGGKGMSPTKAVASDRSTPGGKGITPPAAEVPSSEFVDPVASRDTPGFKPKKAG